MRVNPAGVGRFDRFLLTRPIVGFILIVGVYALVAAILGVMSGAWPWRYFVLIGVGNALVAIWKAHRGVRGQSKA